MSNSLLTGDRFALKDAAAMTCRIDRRLIEEGLVVLRISGQLTGDDVEVLRDAIAEQCGLVAIDLNEVDLVDGSAVNVLAGSEADGIEIRNCPPYIRVWVDQERARR